MQGMDDDKPSQAEGDVGDDNETAAATPDSTEDYVAAAPSTTEEDVSEEDPSGR